jgi:hypothetical protein
MELIWREGERLGVGLGLRLRSGNIVRTRAGGGEWRGSKRDDGKSVNGSMADGSMADGEDEDAIKR